MTDRYQSTPGSGDGAMPTAEWFAALRSGIDGLLEDVLDVGCAEGVMCLLAAQDGGKVLGIGLHDDRMAAALEVTRPFGNIEIREQEAAGYSEPHQTVVFSMMAHWLGQAETARFARLATRNFGVIFRLANDHYAPENGTWFPTLAEMDETVGGVRTSETLLLTQDNGKEVWAATYRTDLRVDGDTVIKNGQRAPLRAGTDLHGDLPFRPRNNRPVVSLSGPSAEAVRELARRVAATSLREGSYPSDFSPRNVICDGANAWLIDDEPEERVEGPMVDPTYLPVWRMTLSAIDLDFSGDLRELL